MRVDTREGRKEEGWKDEFIARAIDFKMCPMKRERERGSNV